MNNNIYRLLNLAGLVVLSFYADKIGLIGYIPSCILAWNAIEGVRVEVKDDKLKNVQLACKDLRISSLEGLVKAQEMVIKNYKAIDKNEIYDKVNKIISSK